MNQEKELLEFIQLYLIKDKTISIGPETLLFKEHVLDSMNILDLIGYIEKKIQRRLKDDEIVMSNFQSAQSINTAFFHE